MRLLLWRQHRVQLAVAAAALAALAAILLPTGNSLENTYRSALAVCRTNGDCNGLGDTLFRSNWDGLLLVIVVLTLGVPGVLGIFWGAPLVAREIENGTIKLVFTQTVSRRNWFAMKVAAMLAAGALWGLAIGGLVSWWSRPLNSLHQNRFDIGHFDVQGVVPGAYAVFGVALGIACGVWIRRTIPAIAVTIAGLVVVRLAVAYGLRAHYMPLVVRTFPFGTKVHVTSGAAWLVSNSLFDGAGHNLGSNIDLRGTGCPTPATAGFAVVGRCLARLGWHYRVGYQPAGRFWAFQGIESGIFVALAVLLVVAAGFAVVRRDA